MVKEIDDQQHKGSFVEEIGKKEKELSLELSDEELGFVNTDVRYLLDQDNKLFSKFYQAEVPQVNPSVAKQIIEKEKAKMMEPILVDMIEKKLEDGVIDELEYLILKDTAYSSFISEEQLKRLIDKIKSKKGIEGSVYIGLKKPDVRPLLNPYWLVHFGNLKESKVEQSSDPFNTTNLHKNIWNQINQYIEYLNQSHLDNEFVKWKIKANQYQIGNLSYTYWGQIYPDHSPFEYGFSIGFIVSSGFTNKWGLKTKKNNPIKSKVGQPCIFLYTTLNNKFMDDVDYDAKLQKEYGLINYELLKRERQKLEEMGALTNALCDRTNDATTINDYFLQKEERESDERLWIYSKIWNVEDFIENNTFNTEFTHQIEKGIITYLTLFSNSVLAINDYAISNGFNAEQIKDMRDKATRNQQILVSEVKENLNKDSKNIKEFVINRGTELKLRNDRIQKVLNMFSATEKPE